MKANIVNMIFGSHMYGLNTKSSDVDYAGIYLPTLNEILLGSYKNVITTSTGDNDSKNNKDDVDIDLYALPFFIKMACKGETKMLDMLHVNPELSTVELGEYGHIWTDLVRQREMFYTTNLKVYMGYIKRQAAKYGLKGSRIAAMRQAITKLTEFSNRELLLKDIWLELPENEYANKIQLPEKNTSLNVDIMRNFYEVNGKKYQETNAVDYTLERITKGLDAYGARALLAEKNQGVDWKAMSHSLRAGYQLRGIFKNNTFSYPLAETEFLLNVKQGKCDYKTEVADVLENLIDEIDVLVLSSNLPTSSDRKRWNQWLINVYDQFLIRPYVFPEGT